MKGSLLVVISIFYSVFGLTLSYSDDGSVSEDISSTDLSLNSIIRRLIDIPPATHQIRHGDLLLSMLHKNFPVSYNSLKMILSRLGEEYLTASELVLANPKLGKYLPDSLTLLAVLEEEVVLFDRKQRAELHLTSWELKIDFLRLALYYALQAKEALPEKLTVLRRHAEVFRTHVLAQCGDPFEVAAFDKGCEVWKYTDTLKKELAIYAAFEVSVYRQLQEKDGAYQDFLTDLEYHMSNGTVLRAVSTHPLKALMSEYSTLSAVWNRRHEALTTSKKYPLPESLHKKSKSVEESEFEQVIGKEIKMLTEQVLTLQAISAQLEKCGDIFSAKLDKIKGENIALKASGTAMVIEGVMLFTNKYQNLLYEIYLERYWRLLSLVGTLAHINSPIPVPNDFNSVLLKAPHLSLATFNQINMDLALAKGRAEEIALRSLTEPCSKTKAESKSPSLLKSILFR